MRKIFTLILCLMASVSSVCAQEECEDKSVVFTLGKEGRALADGEVVQVTTGEEKRNLYEMSSGLWVKNTTQDTVYVSVAYTINEKSNGNMQICFPNSCMPMSEEGETSLGKMSPDSIADLVMEWTAEDYGKASVTFQIKLYEYLGKDYSKPIPKDVYQFLAYGPSVTVAFNYTDPAGIDDATAGSLNAVETARYTLDGQRLTAPRKGLNLVKMSDGRVVKTLVK